MSQLGTGRTRQYHDAASLLLGPASSYAACRACTRLSPFLAVADRVAFPPLVRQLTATTQEWDELKAAAEARHVGLGPLGGVDEYDRRRQADWEAAERWEQRETVHRAHAHRALARNAWEAPADPRALYHAAHGHDPRVMQVRWPGVEGRLRRGLGTAAVEMAGGQRGGGLDWEPRRRCARARARVGVLVCRRCLFPTIR